MLCVLNNVCPHTARTQDQRSRYLPPKIPRFDHCGMFDFRSRTSIPLMTFGSKLRKWPKRKSFVIWRLICNNIITDLKRKRVDFREFCFSILMLWWLQSIPSSFAFNMYEFYDLVLCMCCSPNGKMMYAVKSHRFNKWLRAHIYHFDTQLADVRFVDYGSTERITFNRIYSLDGAHCSLPFQTAQVSTQKF